MIYRSTNADGKYVHFGGAGVFGADYGSGIEINPNSSGVAANISPVGDEANKGLTIVGKGTGTVTLGNSSSPVSLAGAMTGGFQVGSSGSTLSEIRLFTVQYAPPALAANTAAVSTYTVAGLSTRCAILSMTPRLAYSTQYITHDFRCSTADELSVVWSNSAASSIGTGESTGRWSMLVAKF